jgi:uroporphyrinogen-III synthase
MKTIESAKSAAMALSKTTAEEAMAYKKWVLAIGQKVAEAAKEHGVAVSDPEKAVLSEISAALGVSA